VSKYIRWQALLTILGIILIGTVLFYVAPKRREPVVSHVSSGTTVVEVRGGMRHDYSLFTGYHEPPVEDFYLDATANVPLTAMKEKHPLTRDGNYYWGLKDVRRGVVDRDATITFTSRDAGRPCLKTHVAKYADTEILIEGHTDATGSEEHNLTLSRNRAQSVATILENAAVLPTRFTIMGYGEAQPVGDNQTAAGRQANRRVDIAIMANDKLKDAAEKKTEG